MAAVSSFSFWRCRGCPYFYVIFLINFKNVIEPQRALITFAPLCKSIYRFYYKTMLTSGLLATRRPKAES